MHFYKFLVVLWSCRESNLSRDNRNKATEVEQWRRKEGPISPSPHLPFLFGHLKSPKIKG